MYLPGYHKVDLVRFYIESLEVDSVCAASFGKQNEVIKGMFMREVKIVVFLQIGTKPADQQIFLLKIGELADIIYGECALHDNKVT